MKKIILLFVVLSTLLFANVGKVTAVKGGIEVERASGVIGDIKTGFVILEKDIINTKSDGSLQILFEDNTVATIGKDSTFKIEEYLMDDVAPKASFGVVKGTFKMLTGKIGKINPDKFKIKTKNATIGIRGTGILGQVTPQENRVACTSGAIIVTSLGTGDMVEVPAGAITSVPPGAPPAPPRAYTPEETGAIESESGVNEMPDDTATQEAAGGVGETTPATTENEQGENEEGTEEGAGAEEGEGGNPPANEEPAAPGEEAPAPAGAPVALNLVDIVDNIAQGAEDQTENEVVDAIREAIEDNEGLEELLGELGDTQNSDIEIDDDGNVNVSGGGSSGTKSNKTATYYGMHTSVFLPMGSIAIVPDTGAFLEDDDLLNYSITNGVLSGTSSMVRHDIVENLQQGTYAPRNYTISAALSGYTIPSYYSGWVKAQNINAQIDLGIAGISTLEGSFFVDDQQQFFVYDAEFYLEDQGLFEFEENMVFGERTLFSQLPTDGISRYAEPHGDDESIGSMAWYNSMIFDASVPYGVSVNWRNKNWLTYEINSDTIMIVMGRIEEQAMDGSTYALVVPTAYYERALDFAPNEKLNLHDAVEGYVYGDFHQGIGLTFDVTTDGVHNIPITHGEYRISAMEQTSPTPTGTATFYGLAMHQNGPQGLAINIDRDNYSSPITGDIGANFAKFGSASSYITDDTFVSFGFEFYDGQTPWLGAEGWIIAVDTGSLNEDGSNDGISWGFWGADGTAGGMIPGGEIVNAQPWFAGENVVNDISTMIADRSWNTGTASYSGVAMGVRGTDFLDPSKTTMDLGFDFGANTISATIQNSDLGLNDSMYVGSGNGASGVGTFDSSGTYSFEDSDGINTIGGKFYNNGDVTAGAFKFDDSGAEGVFKAKLTDFTP